MRHELDTFLDLRMKAIGYKGQGCISFVLRVMAGTNMALACGEGSYSSCSARIYGLNKDLSFR